MGASREAFGMISRQKSMALSTTAMLQDVPTARDSDL